MATAYSNIQATLNYHLSQMSGLPTVVQWENTIVTPPDDDLYLRTFFLPANPDFPFVGSDGLNYEHGIFQIDVLGLKGSGWGAVTATVDDLVAYFYRDKIITYGAYYLVMQGVQITMQGDDVTMGGSGDITVYIERCYPMRGSIEDDRYKVPVSIDYYGYF